jgi:nitronate monooxygenase
MKLLQLLGTDLPIVQAPMAGVQGSALAVAVSNAGGLGSLPCAMLGLDAMRDELAKIKAQTGKPFNVNFFCHTPPRRMPGARRSGGPRFRLFTRNMESIQEVFPPGRDVHPSVPKPPAC